ncbi:MAG: biotin transporter BioY [Eubacterium sp.]|nr:biotin transporter BioY [Eubacterium sp.]
MKLTLQELARCALMTALVAVGAFIRIPLPGEDYFTMQFIVVALTGMLLGSKKGALVMGVYLLIGLLGIPIFAGGGGIGYVLKPTFGYLLGFVPAAFVGGLISEHRDIRGRYWLAAAATLVIVYLFGMGYKYLLYNFYLSEPLPWSLVLLGVVPLLPKDIAACAVAALLSGRLSGYFVLNEKQREKRESC